MDQILDLTIQILEILELEIELEIEITQLEIELLEYETVNFQSNPIQCNECQKSFSAISTLKLHVEINHFNKKNELIWNKNHNLVICNICSKKFAASTLIFHKEIAHKILTCNSCPKEFKKKSHLRKHVTIEVINFLAKSCNICGKSFEHQTDLKNHMSVNTTYYNRFLMTHVVSRFQNVNNSKNKNFQNCKTKQNSIFEVF